MSSPDPSTHPPVIDLSALSGKLKSVLSSFPKWDLQPLPADKDRSTSEFEPPGTTVIIGKEEICEPTLILPQQEALQDSSEEDSDLEEEESSEEEEEEEDKYTEERKSPREKVKKRTKKSLARISEAPSAIETDSFLIPGPKTASANVGETLPMQTAAPTPNSSIPQMIITSRTDIRDGSSKIPIMATKSEDVSGANRASFEQREKRQKAYDQKSGMGCRGCETW